MHRLLHAVALIALPIRDLIGRFLRRRPSLTPEQRDREDHRPALPSPWSREPRWYGGGFPPRAHNRLTPLPHGGEYFADLCKALETAGRRVTIAAWSLTPLMALGREHREREQGTIVAEMLREASQRAEVYVLMWSGAPAIFQPDTHTVETCRDTLLRIAPRVHCALDHRARFSHDHHQKAVTIDGRIAYVGGIDLTTFQGDRWDTHEHPLRFGPNWHDVQIRVEGECVEDIERNFCQRWNAVTGEHMESLQPTVESSWNQSAQVVRTVPEGIYPFARDGEFGIAHAYLQAIREAKRFIYLENQYLWSTEIVEALIDAMNRPHADPFRIVLVLPARAYTGKYDNDAHVRRLIEADAGRGMFHAYSPYSGGPAFGGTGYRFLPIYVHAKVGIIDDQWLTVGSANLNGRGMATDTEMNVQAIAPEVAQDLRARLWADQLGIPAAEIASTDPITLIDEQWKGVADRLEAALRSSAPPPSGHAIRYSPGSNPGSRALDFLQMWTLER